MPVHGNPGKDMLYMDNHPYPDRESISDSFTGEYFRDTCRRHETANQGER